MHDYDVHEAVYLNCKFDDPRVRGPGPRAGPIWPYSENVLNLTKSSFLLPFTFEKNYMHDYDVHEAVTRSFYWFLHC
jgi:hypothetical protein